MCGKYLNWYTLPWDYSQNAGSFGINTLITWHYVYLLDMAYCQCQCGISLLSGFLTKYWLFLCKLPLQTEEQISLSGVELNNVPWIHCWSQMGNILFGDHQLGTCMWLVWFHLKISNSFKRWYGGIFGSNRNRKDLALSLTPVLPRPDTVIKTMATFRPKELVASLRRAIRDHNSTVKPVYNDHLIGHFSAFWSSYRSPKAT